jgi:hypothetical protein
MIQIAVPLLAVAISQFPTLAPPDKAECMPYEVFTSLLDGQGARVSQTIETPSFPSFKRLMVVTFQGTKQVFGAVDACVVVPALFVDYPQGMSPVPLLQWMKKLPDPST